MKFTCDRCGKRFSSVDEPMAGRVYRIRCRCGNVIQISSPQLMPEGPGRRKGGSHSREARAAGTSPAIPPLPAVPRAATPAGDAGAPVRQGASAARIAAAPPPGMEPDPFAPALAKDQDPFAPSPAKDPDPFAPAPGSGLAAPGVDIEHPQATPASVLMPEAGDLLEPEPLAPPPAAGSPAIPIPQLELSATTPAHVLEPAPRMDPFELEGAPALAEPLPPPAVPFDDPFAAAAAHAAKPDIEITAPTFSPPKVALGSIQPAPKPEWPIVDEVPASLLAPPRDDEASVNLSVSEQRPMARRQPRRRGTLLAVAAGVIVLAGAAGAYAWKLQESRPAPPHPPQARVETPDALPQVPPPVDAKLPAQQPEPPASAAASPPAPSPASAASASAQPAAAVLPPAAAPPPAAPAPAEPPGVSAVDGKEAARGAAAERESSRKAEERRAAAAQNAEAERVARAERKAEADRKAAEEARKAEAERKARADRRTASAGGGVAFEGAQPPKTKPAVDPALAEALKRKEEAVAPKPQPLTEGLDPGEMQAVIRANRPALEACVEKALADPATSVYAGRKVSLIILVAPNGRAEAALEEPDLDASAFGTCVRRAAGKMTFPAFRGEPVGARIPLVLGRG